MRFSSYLVAMLRVRGDREFWSEVQFRRLVKRSVHLFSQAAECALAEAVLHECPSPELEARYHPYMKASRMRGNRSLSMSLVSKFLVRGGGFVSAKGEAQLSELGIAQHRTAFAGKASSEFVTRSLMKTSEFMNRVIEQQDLKTINCCFDAASICHEQASWLHFRMLTLTQVVRPRLGQDTGNWQFDSVHYPTRFSRSCSAWTASSLQVRLRCFRSAAPRQVRFQLRQLPWRRLWTASCLRQAQACCLCLLEVSSGKNSERLQSSSSLDWPTAFNRFCQKDSPCSQRNHPMP